MLRSYEFSLLRTIPGNKTLQLISVGAVGLKGFLVKKPLDPTSRADLVGISVGPHRPTHPAVPASPEENNRHPRQPCSDNAEGPHPVLLLIYVFHCQNL
jgi:hypothetical protein